MQLKFKPNLKQREALKRWVDSTTVEIAYGGAKYGGKSFLGANCIFHDALVYPETFYFIAREQLIDVRKHTIPTIHEVFHKWNIDITDYCKYNGQDNYFKLYNDSRVYMLECKYMPSDPLYERFGSMQMTRGWIEEGGEVHHLAKENLKISIGRRKNDVYKLKPKLLITCNPKKNWLYSEFYKPSITGQLPADRAFIPALPTDNVDGNQEYIKSLSELKDQTMKQRLYFGNWEYDDDPTTLIEYNKILDAFTNKFLYKNEKGEVIEQEKFITADIARFGKDKTVIMVWNGFCVIEILQLEKPSVTESANFIDMLSNRHKVPRSNIIVDEDGVGGGVKDILGCVGFINNATPIYKSEEKQDRENFKNLKSQCYFNLSDRINASGIYIETNNTLYHDAIVEELEQVKQKAVDTDGKKAIQPKEWVKEQIGRSPDFSDTLMMREYFELEVRFNNEVKTTFFN